jgi:hypothetical protein
VLANVAPQNETIHITTTYSEHSTASGALFSFVFITENGDVNFSRSFLLALDRNASYNHTLPFNLYPGHYRVHVYDIEQNGSLISGVGYPAVRRQLGVDGLGTYITMWFNNIILNTQVQHVIHKFQF